MRSRWWWWEWTVSLSLRLSGEEKKSLRIATQQSSDMSMRTLCESICYHNCAILLSFFCVCICLPHLSFLIFFESLLLLKGSLLVLSVKRVITLFCSFWGFVCFVLLLLLHPSIHTWPISHSQILLIYPCLISVISNYFLIMDFFPKNKVLRLHLVLPP